jgi:predicted DNA-binding transcriptional regulator YafY
MKRARQKEKAYPLRRPPVERMMQIHSAIQSRAYPNATTLAATFEVSTKSIHRDLEFMRDRLGLPIEYDGGRFGYHYTGEVRAFPTMQISEGELFALLVAEKSLQQYRGTAFEKPLVSAFSKIASSLPETISLNLANWDTTISFKTSAEPLLNLEIFDTLARAISRREQLEIAYRKPGVTAAEARVVDPYHLANINGEWYLFAFDHLRSAPRTFSPSRIQSLKATGRNFERPKRFSAENWLRDSFAVHSGTSHYDVKIRFDAFAGDYIREKRWHPSQSLRVLKDGRVELEMNLSSLVEIQRWLLSWGGHAVVIKPRELVELMREAAQNILRNYPASGRGSREK